MIQQSIPVDEKTSGALFTLGIDKRGIVFERAAAAWGNSYNWKLPTSAN